MRVLDVGVDKYGLNAYLYDSTQRRHAPTTTGCCSRPRRTATDAVGDLTEGEWADVKVTIAGGALDGKTAGMLVRVETLCARPVPRPAVPHLGDPRHRELADLAGRAGLHRASTSTSPPSSRPRRRPTSPILEAGIISEETYVEQGLYWSTGHWPMLEYVAETYEPDLLLVGMPTTDEFQHQFLGLVSQAAAQRCSQPGLRRRRPRRRQGRTRGSSASAFIRERLRRSPTRRCGWPARWSARTRPRSWAPTTASRRSSSPIDASKVLVDMGLLSRPQTSNCRPATGETIGKAKACWAGGAVQVYLNLAGRDPAGGGLQQVAAADEAATVAAIKAAFLALTDPNDWTHDGNPEGWKVIDRAFTKAEAALHPQRSGLAPPTWRTRPAPATWWSSPTRRTSSTRRRPARWSRPRTSSGSTATSPTCRTWRPTSTCGRRSSPVARASAKGKVDARSIDLAPTLAFMLGIPEPQHSQGKVLLDVSEGGRAYTPISIVGLNDFHGQLDPTTRAYDDGDQRPGRRRGVPRHDVRRGARRAAGAGPDPGRRRQRRRLAAELGAAGGHAGDRRGERLGPGRHVVRQPRVRLRRRAAAGSSRRGPTSRSWRPTSSTRTPERHRTG